MYDRTSGAVVPSYTNCAGEPACFLTTWRATLLARGVRRPGYGVSSSSVPGRDSKVTVQAYVPCDVLLDRTTVTMPTSGRSYTIQP